MSAPLPEASPVLFPSAVDRRRIEDWLTLALVESGSRTQAGAVTPTIDMEAFRAELQTPGFVECKRAG